jgi:hypothetical protein
VVTYGCSHQAGVVEQGVPGSRSAWTEAQEAGTHMVLLGMYVFLHASLDGLHPTDLDIPNVTHTVGTHWGTPR